MIFKLRINDIELDTNGVEYFELVKGSVVGSDIGTINREYSTNITIPATQKNVSIFRAHKLWGGTSEVLNGVAHFGLEAFECLVQLVDFDEKKITIYIIKSEVDYKKAVESTWKESLKKHYNEYAFRILESDPLWDNFEKTILIENTFGLNAGYMIGDGWSVASAISSLNIDKELVYPPAEISDAVILPLRPEGELALIHGEWSDFTYLRTANLPHRGLGYGDTRNQTKAISMEVREDGNYLKLDNISPKFENQPGLDRALMEFGFEVVTGSFTTLQFLPPFSNQAITIDSNITSIEQLIYINRDVWLKSHFTGIMGGSPDLSIRWTLKMFFLSNFKGEGGAIKYPFVIEHAPDIKVVDIVRALALERGMYLKVREVEEGVMPFYIGTIETKDIPNIDSSDIKNVSRFFKSVKKVSIKKGILKAKNNYITYTENEKGENARINIKLDDNALNASLKDEDVLVELPILYNKGYPKDNRTDVIRTSAPMRLEQSKESFRIFRDAYNNPTIYQIEFEKMFEIPESILYIEQLNGLFLPEKIIKTSKETLILNCYKIEKQ